MNKINLPTLLIAGGLTTGAYASEPQKPNIVIFLVDDMGVMDTSVPFLTNSSGDSVRHPLNDLYHTPNMEALAESGIRFSNFYAQSVSSPTRASILTGQNSTRHHTTNWIESEKNNRTDFGPTDWNWEGLTAETITIPQLLREGGYKTIHVGKAHFGPYNSEGENPLNVGFDVNIGGSSIGQPGSYYGESGYGHIKGRKSRAVSGLEKYHNTPTFLTDALTIEAGLEIEKAVTAKKPFFLNLCHYAVHAPFETDKRFAKNYENKNLSSQAIAYATLIEGMDKSLGDLISKLEALGVADNTIILFMGDNGSDAPLGKSTDHASSAPLKGMKGSEYEGGVRTVFIASWAKPESSNNLQKRLPIESGAIQTQIATVMDIFPTVTCLADLKKPKDHIVDGYNLKKQLKNKKNSTRSNDVLMHFPHKHRGSYFTTFISDGWKLIYRYNPETKNSPSYELYNLTNDPYELNNVSNNELKRCNRMISTMVKKLNKEDAQYPISENGEELIPIKFTVSIKQHLSK